MLTLPLEILKTRRWLFKLIQENSQQLTNIIVLVKYEYQFLMHVIGTSWPLSMTRINTYEPNWEISIAKDLQLTEHTLIIGDNDDISSALSMTSNQEPAPQTISLLQAWNVHP